MPADSAVNVRIDKDQVFVSTFRHASADEKDYKIDAVLIAKAVIEAAPNEVARVNCYFYGKDLSSYQEVSVSAGDIKAFASQQLTNEQLLASLSVKTVAGQQSETDKIAAQLQGNAIIQPSDYKTVQDKPESITVNTDLPPWVSDEQAKLEALRIAINTFQALPSAQIVKVNFTDPAQQTETREFDFLTEQLGTFWKAIQSAMGSVVETKKPITFDVQSMHTLSGPEQEKRDALLAQLKEMNSKGIGVAPFVKAFLAIEQAVKRETDAKYILEMVTRLKANVDDQMKAFASAKEKKASKAAEPPKSAAAPPPAVQSAGGGSRWAVGESPIIEGEVLANPDQLVAQYEQRLSRGFKTPEDNPKFVIVLDQVTQILTRNNRAAEAAKYQQRAQQIRAGHHR